MKRPAPDHHLYGEDGYDHYYGVVPRPSPWPMILTAVSFFVGWGGAVLAIAWHLLTEGGLP